MVVEAGGGWTDQETRNRTTYVGEGNTSGGFYSPIQELMRMAWARMSGANKNRTFLRSGFKAGGIPGPGWYQNPVTGQWEQRQGTSTVSGTGRPRNRASDIPGPTEPPGGWQRERGGSYRPGGTTGANPRTPAGGGTTTPPTTPPAGGTPPPTPPPATPPPGGATPPPGGGGPRRQDPSWVAGYDPYGRDDPTARSAAPQDGFGATPSSSPAQGGRAAWEGEEKGVGDKPPDAQAPPDRRTPRDDPWRDLPTNPPANPGGGGGGGGHPEDGSGTGNDDPPRRTPETQNPDMPPGGELPSEVPGWFNDPPRYGDDPNGTGPDGGGFDSYGGRDGALPGGMSGYYLSELAAKGFDPDVENALRNSTMAAVGNSANTARRAMDRRIASTGSDAGYFGAMSDLADSEAANTEGAARSNVMANAQERARRREIGERGLMDLTEQEIADEQFWARIFSGIGTKPRESTGDTSGVNVNLGFGF